MSKDLLRDYFTRTSYTEEYMLYNNNYVSSCQTVKEWDDKRTFDGPLDESSFEHANFILNELLKGM